MLTTDQRITPNLRFDDQAEAAARHDVSSFDDSEILTSSRYGSGGPKAEGSVLIVGFTLEGLSFTALNGGPQFPFTEAVPFIVHCSTQEEVDHYWERLPEGGDAKAQRTMQAMLQMKKLDIGVLGRARDGAHASSAASDIPEGVR